MKRLALPCLFSVFLILLSAACSGYMPDEDEETSATETSECHLQLAVRRTDEVKINYPLSVFLFDDTGELVLQTEVSDAETPFTHSLNKGEYILSAFSGLSEDDFTLPLEPLSTSYLSIKEPMNSRLPLMSGQSRIQLKQPTEVTLTLSYVVSALQFSFTGIPADATEVSLQVSPVSTGYSFDGNYKEETDACSVSCSLEENVWTAGPVYVLPSTRSKAHLSITVTRPGKNETYSYTYAESLSPGQPYNFSGSYSEGVSLEGNFEIEGWKPAVDIEFDFSTGDDSDTEQPEEPEEGENPPLSGDGILYASSLPEANSIWEDYYVWKTEPAGNNAVNAILIAPEQWYELAIDGMERLETYEINGLTDWRVFTETEARELIQFLQGATIESLNELLSQASMDQILYTKEERYLCAEGNKSFCLKTKTCTNIGTKTNYYLRPVKTVCIKLK